MRSGRELLRPGQVALPEQRNLCPDLSIFNWRIIAFNAVLVSAVQQCESAVSVCISPPSLASLLSPTPIAALIM